MVELVTAIALGGVLTLVVGTLLVSGHRHWNVLYGRVYRSEAEDVFAVQRYFDAVCRKCSAERQTLGANNDWLELYYWNPGSSVKTPENYVRLFLQDGHLKAEHGVNKAGTWTPDVNQSSTIRIVASNISEAQFNVHGAAVLMILHYNNGQSEPLICSSVRKN